MEPSQLPAASEQQSAQEPLENSPTTVFTPMATSPRRRRRVWFLLVPILVVLTASFAVIAMRSNKQTSALAVTAPAVVSITKNGFTPATIRIKTGQAVVWTNNDSAKHEINSDPYPTDNDLADFNDTEPLAQNDSYSFIFTTPGTYNYHDQLNPLSFAGTVVVTN